MKKMYPLFIILVLFTTTLFAQPCTITGIKTIPGDYSSITIALANLQINGVAGPVVLELQAGYTGAGETYPITLPALTAPVQAIPLPSARRQEQQACP